MDPVISIIVPVYNTERYIDKCVQSLLNQTLYNIEVILVDDGAKDSSGLKCDQWKERDKRVKVLHKQNGGLSSARDAGMALATAAWIGFCDSDDYVEPDMYERMYANALEDVDIVVCGHFVECSGEIVETVHGDKEIHKMSGREALYGILADRDINSFAWDKIYRRELFAGFSWFPVSYHEDIASTFKLVEKARNVTVMNVPLYHYIRNPNSICHTLSAEKIYASYLAFCQRRRTVARWFPELEAENEKRIYERALAAVHTYVRSGKEKTDVYRMLILDMRAHYWKIVTTKKIGFSIIVWVTVIKISVKLFEISSGFWERLRKCIKNCLGGPRN